MRDSRFLTCILSPDDNVIDVVFPVKLDTDPRLVEPTSCHVAALRAGPWQYCIIFCLSIDHKAFIEIVTVTHRDISVQGCVDCNEDRDRPG